MLTVNVIFNCNNQLSCYRVARAIAWLQLMTTFVHLRWYAVIQNNTWSRLQHEGVTICNSLSCSFQCQCCPPYLWIDMSLYTNALCCIVQAIDSMSTFLHAPLLVSWCATRTDWYSGVSSWPKNLCNLEKIPTTFSRKLLLHFLDPESRIVARMDTGEQIGFILCCNNCVYCV